MKCRDERAVLTQSLHTVLVRATAGMKYRDERAVLTQSLHTILRKVTAGMKCRGESAVGDAESAHCPPEGNGRHEVQK
jgi:hypothetical protein